MKIRTDFSPALNEQFAMTVIDMRTLLDSAVDWIGQHLDPEDVFDDLALERWAEQSGWTRGGEG